MQRLFNDIRAGRKDFDEVVLETSKLIRIDDRNTVYKRLQTHVKRKNIEKGQKEVPVTDDPNRPIYKKP